MWKGILTIACGAAMLAALAMSSQFNALAGMSETGTETGILNALPTAADVPAVLSYTCRIADMMAIGGFCGM